MIPNKKKQIRILLLLAAAVLILTAVCLFVGVSHLSLMEGIRALLGQSTDANNRILRQIRLPRVLAALLAGAGLSVSGLMMQTTLGNAMASPSTLGVSQAAVFGANLSIIAFAGGFLETGRNLSQFTVGSSPFATSFMAFVFALLSILLVLGLCRIRSFSPDVVVLAGLAIGSVWTAATTVLQFFATDVGLSAAVIWSFGDLGRATYQTDGILFICVLAGIMFFRILAWRYNALLSGDAAAKSMGVSVDRLRFLTLLTASAITAVCVSFLGIIGFVGIICPHVVKKLMGEDHRFSISGSALCGSLLLLFADTLSRSIGNGTALPVGAVTSLLGAPFFLSIIFAKGGRHAAD